MTLHARFVRWIAACLALSLLMANTCAFAGHHGGSGFALPGDGHSHSHYDHHPHPDSPHALDPEGHHSADVHDAGQATPQTSDATPQTTDCWTCHSACHAPALWAQAAALEPIAPGAALQADLALGLPEALPARIDRPNWRA